MIHFIFASLLFASNLFASYGKRIVEIDGYKLEVRPSNPFFEIMSTKGVKAYVGLSGEVGIGTGLFFTSEDCSGQPYSEEIWESGLRHEGYKFLNPQPEFIDWSTSALFYDNSYLVRSHENIVYRLNYSSTLYKSGGKIICSSLKGTKMAYKYLRKTPEQVGLPVPPIKIPGYGEGATVVEVGTPGA